MDPHTFAVGLSHTTAALMLSILRIEIAAAVACLPLFIALKLFKRRNFQ